MSRKYLKVWIKAAGVRAVKTMAQCALASMGTAAFMDQVNWQMVISASVLAGVASLLTSCVGLPELQTEQEGGRESS